MDTNDQKSAVRRSDAVIRRAFYRSIAVILVLAAAGLLLSWLLLQDDSSETVIEEAIVTGPVATGTATPQTPPMVMFTDITAAAGIDFVHVNGAYGDKLIPEPMGSGAAFFDYDNDGDPDLLLVNSRNWPDRETGNPATLALYRNDGSGHFTDVTAAAGLAISCYGMGVAAGDYDNDGWTDLYITALGSNYLLKNDNGRFSDVTAASQTAGLDSDWSSTAAFFDYDNDNDLDLFVSNYVLWTRDLDLEINFQVTGLGRTIGAPNHFNGTNNRLYRNDGNGRFTDVSHSAGITVNDPVSEAPQGKALAVAVFDYDRDGRLDLLVANDTVRNYLFHNLGDGRFEEVGALEGIAFDRNGKATGAMGIDTAHFRNDVEIGVAIGNFANEMSSLLVTVDGQPPFADEAILEGIGPASRLALTFGLFFFDYDLDGRLDLFQANGHLESEINVIQPSQTYAQPAQLFWNCGEDCRTRFIPVADIADLQQPMVGRGAAYADIDADGDLDIVVIQNGDAARLFRNDQQTGHHWLRLRLEGNNDAIGAQVELKANGITQRRRVMPTRSYLSQVELPVTFGLADSTTVDSLVITWPDGTTQTVAVSDIDTTLTVHQPGKH
ncbi:MAG: CRTAC1 family protein [Pseudomonadota bacterium]